MFGLKSKLALESRSRLATATVSEIQRIGRPFRLGSLASGSATQRRQSAGWEWRGVGVGPICRRPGRSVKLKTSPMNMLVPEISPSSATPA